MRNLKALHLGKLHYLSSHPPGGKPGGGEKIFDELLGGAKKILTNFWGGRKKFRRTFGGGEKNFNALSMEIGGFRPIPRGGEKNFDGL